MLTFLSFRLLRYLLLCFSLMACCRDTDLELNPNLISTWVPYQSLQKIKFLGPKNDTLLFMVHVRHYHQEATDKACGLYRIQTTEATLTTAADPATRFVFSVSHEIVLNLKISHSQTNSIGLEAKFNTVSEEYITHAWRDTYAKEKIINGRPYPRILQVFGNQIPGELGISEILYAAEVGLIGFKTFNGNWYYKI